MSLINTAVGFVQYESIKWQIALREGFVLSIQLDYVVVEYKFTC